MHNIYSFSGLVLSGTFLTSGYWTSFDYILFRLFFQSQKDILIEIYTFYSKNQLIIYK